MPGGEPDRILVVGGGSWGTALANLLAGAGHEVTIWAREAEVVDAINRSRENTSFLPGITLSGDLTAIHDLAVGVDGASVLVSSVPTQHAASVWGRVAPIVSDDATIVTVSKGIEIGTHRTPSSILADTIGRADRIVALSGPSFAREVATEHPTAVVAAGTDATRTRTTQELFSTPRFRVYSSDDIVGVELGGALKNVIAVAAGIVEGLRFGHNTMAALMTRGLAELSRLGVALGGDPFTFAGLSGMGDLVLTCTGGLSRNRAVGVELGRGRSLEDITEEMNMVAEGVKTSRAVKQLSTELGVEMPICDQVHAVLYEQKPAAAVAHDLMLRPLKGERPA